MTEKSIWSNTVQGSSPLTYEAFVNAVERLKNEPPLDVVEWQRRRVEAWERTQRLIQLQAVKFNPASLYATIADDEPNKEEVVGEYIKLSELKARVGMSGFDFTGKIERFVGSYRTGNGQYGPYSYQDMIVTDGTGTEKMAVTVKNHPALPESAVGKIMTVKCKSFNGTLRGTQVVADTDDDGEGGTQTQIKIVITKSAVITVTDKDAVSPSHNYNRPQTVHELPEAEISLTGPEMIINSFKIAADILTNPEVLAMQAACVAKGWSTEDVRALAITIVIQRSRK